ncbi:TSC-22 Dip Bun domain containing protein [Aphelenchoides fujianensis]|nr:TSC-22 Dip Bun domain containing protein [Aphelenchoides fujianensis]
MSSMCFLLACTSWSHRRPRMSSQSHGQPIPTISVDQPTPPQRRVPSTDDGRFKIIDAAVKHYDSFDEETALSDGESIGDNSQFSKSYISSISSPHMPCTNMNHAVQSPKFFNSSASRFKIVPVEKFYKRGRWTACDFYQPAANPPDPKRVLSGNHEGNRGSSHPPTPTHGPMEPVFHLTPPPIKRIARPASARTAPLATPDPMSTHSLAFPFSDDSDRENSIPGSLEKNTIHRVEPPTPPLPHMHEQVNLSNLRENLQNRPRLTPPEIRPVSGRISPYDQMLNQFGLERSLSATTTPIGTPDRAALLGTAGLPGLIAGHPHEHSSGIVSGNVGNANGHPLGGTPTVAIDSKIEQAMDLVKSHLMFAVREEIDHLRSRIIDLESNLVHLEAENSILRENVPANILQSLSLQPSSRNSNTMT